MHPQSAQTMNVQKPTSQAERNALIASHFGIAKKIVEGKVRRCPWLGSVKEDLLQDAYIAMVQVLKIWEERGNGPFAGYVFRAVERVVCREVEETYKANRTMQVQRDPEAAPVESPVEGGQVASDCASDLNRLAHYLVENMPRPQRNHDGALTATQIVALYFRNLSGVSTRELEVETGVSFSTLASKFRAVEQIKERYVTRVAA